MKFSRGLKTSLWLVMVVIAILVVLPLFSGRGPQPKKLNPKTEISALVHAIEAYRSAYGKFPVSDAMQQSANGRSGDATFGSLIEAPESPVRLGSSFGGNLVLNSEVIAILMDRTNYPGNPSQFTSNTNHVRNPMQVRFLEPTITDQIGLPGVGPDLVYRDPWGTPYFITMDLNQDGNCEDLFYGKKAVSQKSGANGFNGLTNATDADGHGNHFQFHGTVMVWSAGPDKKINLNLSADAGENKDNVLSWP
jgi:hypothetical protein